MITVTLFALISTASVELPFPLLEAAQPVSQEASAPTAAAALEGQAAATSAPTPLSIQIPAGSSPSAVYEGLVAARRVLRDQLSSLERKRDNLARDIENGKIGKGDVATAGLEARIREIDAQISIVDAQVAQANLDVARAAAIPGAVVERPPPPRKGPPPEIFALGGFFTVVLCLPIVIAYARRLWKRGATVIAPVPADVRAKIDGLTQAVEAISVEVERIGEGQRFVTRVLAESRPVQDKLPVDR